MKKHYFLGSTTVVFALSLLIAACHRPSAVEFIQEPYVVPNPNSAAPLTSFVNFETEQPYDSVRFQLSDSERSVSLAYSRDDKMDVGYLLLLMRPGTAQQVQLAIKDGHGQWHEERATLSLTTPGLPNDDTLFPKISITKPDTTTDKEKLTLFNPRRRLPRADTNSNTFNQSFGMLVIVNQQGDVLWYYQTDTRISDFDILPNGHLSYMTQDSKLVEIDFAGNVVRQWYAANRPEGKDEQAIPVDALTFHHDAALLPDGNRLVLSTEVREIDDYYTSERNKKAPRKRQKVMGDVVKEFAPDGTVVHQWHAFDHLPVMRIGYETFSGYWGRRGFPGVIDWSHANAVVPVPGEDAYLVNFRYQSAMVKVNKTTGQTEWIFAEPSGWGSARQDKLLTLPEGDWNWHQHSPRYTDSGHLLFFNNNNYQARPFKATESIEKSPSYVVEYAIDEAHRTVDKIWTSKNDHVDKVVSIAMGRVSELSSSGNVLACFGALLPQEHFDEMTWWNRAQFTQWTMVREYAHTSPATVVWEMQLLPLAEGSSVGWTLFGAERIEI